MALLGALNGAAASSTDFNWQLLTRGISYELARLLLNVSCGTGGLVHSPAFFGTRSIANLLQGLVALLHRFIICLLLERDLAGLLKVLLTHLLLSRLKLRHIGVMALLNVLVCALEDGILLECGDRFLLLDAAESRLRVRLAAAEVDSSSDGAALLSTLPAELVEAAVEPPALAKAHLVSRGERGAGQ